MHVSGFAFQGTLDTCMFVILAAWPSNRESTFVESKEQKAICNNPKKKKKMETKNNKEKENDIA